MRSPNVILILASQHRRDFTGYAGHPNVRTPNLDSLARHGASFDQTICQSTVPAASRATMLTSRYPASHGITRSGQGLRGAEPTLPGVLRENGYNTALIGETRFRAVHRNFGFDVIRTVEQDREFRHEDDYRQWLQNQKLVNSVDDWEGPSSDRAAVAYRAAFGAVASPLEAANYSTNWIGNQAVRFVQVAREPFFMMVSFTKPAAPFDPPKPWDTMYAPEEMPLPSGFREGRSEDGPALSEAIYRKVLAYYCANISYVDSQVGRILATVSARGHTNNVVVYTSDCGAYLGHHGLMHDSDDLPYDTLIRVPLIISGVVGQRHGASESVLAELTDLMPTILETTGHKVPQGIQGFSLMPQLRGNSVPIRDAAYCEASNSRTVIRDREFKLIDAPTPAARRFFNIESDPDEMEDLRGRPAVVSKQVELTKLLRKVR